MSHKLSDYLTESDIVRQSANSRDETARSCGHSFLCGNGHAFLCGTWLRLPDM